MTEPKWEDPECANGGKWSVASNIKANLDNMWLETVGFLSADCYAYLYILGFWLTDHLLLGS